MKFVDVIHQIINGFNLGMREHRTQQKRWKYQLDLEGEERGTTCNPYRVHDDDDDDDDSSLPEDSIVIGTHDRVK